MAKRLAIIFNVSAEEIDLAVPMTMHGVDSLVAVELRNWLSGAAKDKISIFEITQSSYLMEFVGLIVKRSRLGARSVGEAVTVIIDLCRRRRA